MEKLYTTLCPDKNWTPKEIVIIQQNREILAIQTTEQINKKMQFL